MLRTAIALSLFIVVAACSKKDEKPVTDDKAAPVEKTAPADKADKTADVPAATSTPVQTNPKDLYAELTKPGADTMALLTKYDAGATVTGKVIAASKEESGTPVIFLDIDGKHKMSLKFTDPASVKGTKIGDTLTVTCKIGGADEQVMMVTDCAKK